MNNPNSMARPVLAAPGSGKTPEAPSPYVMSPLQPRSPNDPFPPLQFSEAVLLIRTVEGRQKQNFRRA